MSRTALLASSAGLLALGGLVLVSATRWDGPGLPARQAVAAAVGLALGLALYRWPVRRATWALYALGLASLVAVLAVGSSAKGAQRWLWLGPLGTVQPSEPMKLLLVLALADLLSRRRAFFSAWVVAGIPFLLVAAQPDLGTGLVLVATAFGMLFVSRTSPVYLAGVATAGLAGLTFVLKDYQRDRLLVFLQPDVDPMGVGYSLAQSRTAIGSGGLFGKGLFAGHLTQNGFVPENWTDFAFTVVGEELGLVGCLGLLLLVAVQLGSLLAIAWRRSDSYSRLLASGVAVMLGFQALVNVAMTLGMAPVVGVPLPWVSYGGTAMVTNLAAVGLAAGLTRQSPVPAARARPVPVRRRLPLAS
ncbi:MAG: FtsW/RodA/SpoVE family cell cycle protein [Candidatus Eremiobacterota bacterium]